jgi:hypothetical protein
LSPSGALVMAKFERMNEVDAMLLACDVRR